MVFCIARLAGLMRGWAPLILAMPDLSVHWSTYAAGEEVLVPILVLAASCGTDRPDSFVLQQHLRTVRIAAEREVQWSREPTKRTSP